MAAPVYLPKKSWSTRYGKDYFTVSMERVYVHDDAFAQYELQVSCGSRSWTVLRRFSEFDQLRAKVCSLAGDRTPLLPPKTYWCRDLNPDFLENRRRLLADFLHHLLVIPSIASDPAVRDFLKLDEPKFLYV